MASAYASAINEILPDCVQVADSFHLLQNLLDRLKDILRKNCRIIKEQRKTGKKQELVRNIRNRWQHLENRKYAMIVEEFEGSVASARKYILMTDEEVEKLDEIKKCQKRVTQADGYINMIYKMLRDGVRMTL